MPRLDQLADDLAGEEAGRTFTWRGVDVGIRSIRSKRVSAAMERAGIGRRARSGSYNERDEARFEEILARDVITGWPAGERGFQNAAGDVPYAPETALNILRDEAFRTFKKWVIDIAQDPELFWRSREGQTGIEPGAEGNS